MNLNIGAGIGAFVLILVLVNGSMPDTTKFALIVGLIVAVALRSKVAPAAGGHH